MASLADNTRFNFNSLYSLFRVTFSSRLRRSLAYGNSHIFIRTHRSNFAHTQSLHSTTAIAQYSDQIRSDPSIYRSDPRFSLLHSQRILIYILHYLKYIQNSSIWYDMLFIRDVCLSLPHHRFAVYAIDAESPIRIILVHCTVIVSFSHACYIQYTVQYYTYSYYVLILILSTLYMRSAHRCLHVNAQFYLPYLEILRD